MLVSILVPIYNVENYIEQCVRSLFEQTYPSCEFIFVDDCSPDNSVGLLEQLIDRDYPDLEGRVRIVRHSENRGLTAARKSAIEAAHGRYILFVDSDDWIDCEAVSKMVANCDRGRADLISTNFILSYPDREGIYLDHKWIGGADSSLRVVLAQNFAIENSLCGVLIKRDLFTGGDILFDPRLRMGEDMVILVQLLLRAKHIKSISGYHYYYRQSVPGSITFRPTPATQFNYLRAVCVANSVVRSCYNPARLISLQSTFRVQRMNIKRWLLNRSSQRNAPLSLLFRIYCQIVNRLWLAKVK